MFDRTIEPDPRPAAPQSRATYRMRDGHRREYDASRDRGSISFRERCRGALADIGIYGAVSYRDLAEAHFGGHPYTTRRAVNAWIREGLAKESTAKGPKGRPFKVLTLTRKGAAAIRDLDAGHGLDPGQHIRSAARLLQHAQLAHDTAIYRACGRERQRLLERGAAIRRVRLDGELKSAVARKSESARARDGRRAADAERHRAAGSSASPSTPRAACSTPMRRSSTPTPRGGAAASTSRSRRATTARDLSGPRPRPGSGCTQTGRPERGCLERSAARTMAPPYGVRPSGTRPRSNSSTPPCNPGRSAPD